MSRLMEDRKGCVQEQIVDRRMHRGEPLMQGAVSTIAIPAATAAEGTVIEGLGTFEHREDVEETDLLRGTREDESTARATHAGDQISCGERAEDLGDEWTLKPAMIGDICSREPRSPFIPNLCQSAHRRDRGFR